MRDCPKKEMNASNIPEKENEMHLFCPKIEQFASAMLETLAADYV